MPLESTRPWEINTCAISCNITPNNPASHYLGPIMFHLTNRQSGGRSIICGLHMPIYIPSPLTYSQTYSHTRTCTHTDILTQPGLGATDGYSLGMSWVQIHSILGVPTYVHTHTHTHSAPMKPKSECIWFSKIPYHMTLRCQCSEP